MAYDDPEFNGKKSFDILMSDLEPNTTTKKALSDMLHLNNSNILLILLATIMITVQKKIYSTTTMTEKEVDQSKHWSNMFFRTSTSQQMNFTEEQ